MGEFRATGKNESGDVEINQLVQTIHALAGWSVYPKLVRKLAADKTGIMLAAFFHFVAVMKAGQYRQALQLFVALCWAHRGNNITSCSG